MSAAVSLAPAPVGTINFFETRVGASEEYVTDGVRDRFRSVLARLRDHRGFRIRQDRSVHKLIRRGYYDGRKGDLELRAEHYGRTFSIEFFQNVNFENRHGGRYDFGKFGRMPKTMQLACVVEMSHVLRKLLELGYVFDGTRQGITSAELLPVFRHAQGRTDEGDPLAQFNRHWTPDRFERDESGWPTLASMNRGTCRSDDRDGRPLVSGETMYCRRDGRLYRGVARPTPNENWILISHGDGIYVHPRELFRCEDPAAAKRRVVPKQAQRVRAELDKALKANDYRRVEVLARVAGGAVAQRSRWLMMGGVRRGRKYDGMTIDGSTVLFRIGSNAKKRGVYQCLCACGAGFTKRVPDLACAVRGGPHRIRCRDCTSKARRENAVRSARMRGARTEVAA